tara:strand:- start:2124 stop:2675 length:552 start_codon:yes stop_codon:yes gene_type:complete
MPITSLKFRPGINKETTSYSNKGGWNDCDKIRFRFGYPEKLGGWEKYSNNTFLGSSRSLHAWANLQGDNYLGIGTEIKFYIEESLDLKDITPIRRKVVNDLVTFNLDSTEIFAAPSGVQGITGLGSVDQGSVVEAENLGLTSGVGSLRISTSSPFAENTGIVSHVGTVTVAISNEKSVIVGGG